MGETQSALRVADNAADTVYLKFLEKQQLTKETRAKIEEVYSGLFQQLTAEGDLEIGEQDVRGRVVIFSSACINSNIYTLMKQQAAKKLVRRIGCNSLYSYDGPSFVIFNSATNPIEEFRFVDIIGEHTFYMMVVPEDDWNVFATNYNPKNFEKPQEAKLSPDLERLYELLIIEKYNEIRPDYFTKETPELIDLRLWLGRGDHYIFEVKVLPEAKAKFYDCIKNRREVYEEMDQLIKKLDGDGLLIDAGDGVIYLPAKSSIMKQLSTLKDVARAERIYRFTSNDGAKRIRDLPFDEPPLQKYHAVSGYYSDDDMDY